MKNDQGEGSIDTRLCRSCKHRPNVLVRLLFPFDYWTCHNRPTQPGRTGQPGPALCWEILDIWGWSCPNFRKLDTRRER